MKTKLFLLFMTSVCFNINAQWLEHIISTEVFEAGSVFTADINGDGDMDVLSAATGGNSIDWWENDGTSENFEQHNISTNVDRPYQVFAADINGDGDMDVLYPSRDDDKLVWHENDGDGNFGPQQLITAQANTDGPRFLDVADIDGDGWDDVISASAFDHKFVWYKNLGKGDFGDINTNQRIISEDENQAISVHAVDIDGDGDFDVAAASYVGDEITWHENTDGAGNSWTRHVVESNRDGAASVSSGDFDEDGDMDLVSASQFDNTIAWHENTDGAGPFDTDIIDVQAGGAVFVYAIDIDGDKDMDFLAALLLDSEIVAYVNKGDGEFTRHIITSNVDFPVSVHAEDIDGYECIDVLSASVLDNTIAWYENMYEKCILSVNENILVDFSVYPSPTSGVITVQSKTAISQIEVYTVFGQLILSNSNKNDMDLSNVSQGIYFIKIKDINGDFGIQKVVKK